MYSDTRLYAFSTLTTQAVCLSELYHIWMYFSTSILNTFFTYYIHGKDAFEIIYINRQKA